MKKEYIEPEVKVYEIRFECMLDASVGGSLGGVGNGGSGSGMEADANEDAWSGDLW